MDATSGEGSQGVVLEVPAEGRSLRLLRLAAADAAAELGFDVDRVETARLVVDELASVLIGEAGGGRLRVCITRSDSAIELEGTIRCSGEAEVRVDTIVRHLLDTSIGEDSWSVRARMDLLSFHASVPARRDG